MKINYSIFIELGKFKKTQLTSVADEWLHLFKCATQETEPPKDIKSSKVLDAYHMIERYKLTPAEYDLYIRTKLQEDAEEIALEENFNKGKAEEKIAMAKKMLANNESIEKIVKYTELLDKDQILTGNFIFDVAVRFASDSFEYFYSSDGSIELSPIELLEVI